MSLRVFPGAERQDDARNNLPYGMWDCLATRPSTTLRTAARDDFISAAPTADPNLVPGHRLIVSALNRLRS
jgi:hypothetical protein